MNWQTLLAIDFDKWAALTYRANFPGVRVECGPVADFIDRLPDADVVIGGPPCQPFSDAGENEGEDDERDCIPDFCAAVERVKPRMFLMENVRGLLKEKHLRYFGRVLTRLEAAGPGYVVHYQFQNAVSFGVPQFRERVWVWGIRRDLYAAGVRHQWPKPTHTWPPPEPCMFGGALLAGVTVGQALEIDGWYDAQNATAHGPNEPIGTIQGEAQSKGGDAGHYAIRRPRGFTGPNDADRRDHPITEPCPTVDGRHGGSGLHIVLDTKQKRTRRDIGEPSTTVAADSRHTLAIQSHADPARTIDEPAQTLRSGGGGHDGCCVRIIGGGGNPHFAGDDRTERDITDEPSTTISASHTHNAIPAVVKYRWSDAMLTKHPPASPAPTVQAKWFKGGAEGLLRWKQTKDGLWVRRLTPLECARLQSLPDSFAWPEGMPKTHAYRVIGNGWAAAHGAAFSAALAAADPDSHTVIDLFCGGGLGASGWHGNYWSFNPKAEVAA